MSLHGEGCVEACENELKLDVSGEGRGTGNVLGQKLPPHVSSFLAAPSHGVPKGLDNDVVVGTRYDRDISCGGMS